MKTETKLPPRIRALLTEIEAGWPANIATAPTMPKRVRTNVEEFCRSNQDGRGLRVTARCIVERTLKHIKSAERKAVGSGPLAHKARKLLKSLQHYKRFEVTIKQARGFAGEVQKAGRRRAQRTAICDAVEFRCGTLHGVVIWAVRVVSVYNLIQVGRTLD